jgi:hypothetical protein
MRYTLEDIFRIVKERAKTPRKAMISGIMPYCKYRAPNGLKCFVGELIPDEVYKPEMEGMMATELFISFPEFRELFVEDKRIKMILSLLQVIHDVDHPDEWESRLENLFLPVR